ncbi:MAG: YHS domain-containing protein [Candidatus Thermoplasmatota archaeon]
MCGCVIDSQASRFSSRHGGQLYHFCAETCQRAFEANPSRYVGSPRPGQLPVMKG